MDGERGYLGSNCWGPYNLFSTRMNVRAYVIYELQGLSSNGKRATQIDISFCYFVFKSVIFY